ncbi:hypothetical protein IJJ18_00090 [Candidatus Saccharibacteria bacterium]|nr:hypothetical protein [Candidatus Saccharibacteria bacterium]
MDNEIMASLSLAKYFAGKGQEDKELKAALESGAYEMVGMFYLHSLSTLFYQEHNLAWPKGAIEFLDLFGKIQEKYIPSCLQWGRKQLKNRLCPDKRKPIAKHPERDILLTVKHDLEWNGYAPDISAEPPQLVSLALARRESSYPGFGAAVNLVCWDKSLVKSKEKFKSWAKDFIELVLGGFGADILENGKEISIIVHEPVIYEQLESMDCAARLILDGGDNDVRIS